MQIVRAHKIQLIPNNKQRTFFKKASGVSRFTWNHALCEWDLWHKNGYKPTAFKLKKSFNQYRNEVFPWMQETHRDAYAQAFTDLGTAFQRFFNNKAVGHPKFKKKGSKDSFYIANDQFNIEGSKIRIPKLGWVRLAEELRFLGKINSATVSRVADRWFVSVSMTIEIPEPARKPSAVGVDVGIKTLAFLSNNEVFVGPKPHKALLNRLRRLNKSLARKVKGSNNWKKAKVKLSRLHARIANIRKDSLHKLSSYLCSKFGTIGIEDLNIKGMVKNHKLSRSILDMGWYEFFRQLDYKAVASGSIVVKADRFFPSTKMCSQCGCIQDMPLHKRTYTCDCGLTINRDLNAAINLMNFTAGSVAQACGLGSSGF